MSSDHFFLCQQKSGVWYYDPRGEKREDIRDFISNYILSQEGLITWDKLKERISDAGYVYTEDTIRSYLSIFCRRGLDDPNIWVHRDYANRYSNIRLRKESHNTKKRTLPAYYSQIIQKTLSILCANPSRQARMTDIYDQCKDLLPTGISQNVIYKIWKTCDSIETLVDPNGKKWLRYIE